MRFDMENRKVLASVGCRCILPVYGKCGLLGDTFCPRAFARAGLVYRCVPVNLCRTNGPAYARYVRMMEDKRLVILLTNDKV